MKYTNKKGISLVVLIITVVVTIILTSIVIGTLNTKGIIGKASKTVIKTELSSLQDEVEEKTMSKSMKRDLIKVLKLSDLDIQSNNYEEITAVKDGTLLVLTLTNTKEADQLINYRIYGNSSQYSNIFNKEDMVAGFLPMSGAYPTTSDSYPDAVYTVIDVKAGQTLEITYNGDKASAGRIRCIDSSTNQVVQTISAISNEYYTSTSEYYNGFTNGTITANKDFKIGVMFLSALHDGFDLQIKTTTPTTATSVEVDGVGNRKIDYNRYINAYIASDKYITPDIVGTKKLVLSEYIQIEPNTTYVVSMYNTYSDETTTVSGAAYDENKNVIDLIYTIDRTDVGTYTASFTTPSNAKYIAMCTRSTDTNVKLYEADGVTEYMPKKYKVPLVIMGKNIGLATDIYGYRTTDPNNNRTEYSELIEDGRNCIRFTDSVGFMYTDMHFKENTQYTVQFDVKTTIKTTGNTDGSHAFRFFYSDGTFSNVYVSRDTDWEHKTLTSTAGKTVIGVGLTSYNYTNWLYIDKDTFQIEEGTTATEYEPYIEPINVDIYLDEPLRKVGDVADYIDSINSRVVRNIGVIESYNGEDIESEYLSTTGSLTTGATVYYQLDKPVYETVEIPKVPTVEGTTMIAVGTKLLPSDMRVDY